MDLNECIYSPQSPQPKKKEMAVECGGILLSVVVWVGDCKKCGGVCFRLAWRRQ